MDLVKLKTFLTVAELRSFSKASELLYISQPAVSQHIRSLEKEIGAKLFIKKNHYLELSKEGQRLYAMAKVLIRDYEKLLEEVSNIKEEVKAQLVIGTNMTLGEYLLPKFIAEFLKEYDYFCSIKLYVGNSRQVEEGIVSGILQVGILEEKPLHKSLKSIPWFEDEILPFAHKGHIFTKLSKVSLRELMRERIILREKGSITRFLVERGLRGLGLEPHQISPFMEVNCNRTIINLVKRGLGVSFLARSSLKDEISRGEVMPFSLEGFKEKKRFYLIYNSESVLPRSVKNFLEFLRERCL